VRGSPLFPRLLTAFIIIFLQYFDVGVSVHSYSLEEGSPSLGRISLSVLKIAPITHPGSTFHHDK